MRALLVSMVAPMQQGVLQALAQHPPAPPQLQQLPPPHKVLIGAPSSLLHPNDPPLAV